MPIRPRSRGEQNMRLAVLETDLGDIYLTYPAGIQDNGELIFLALDSLSRAQVVVDYAHHEIHDGDHYTYTDSVELDSASQDYLITTPDTEKYTHMLIEVDGSAITQFLLYEGGNRNGTTPQTAYNNNRNSAKVPGVTIHKGTSGGTTDGTLITQYKSGSASNQSRSQSQSRNDNEFILRTNTKYLLRIVSSSNDNLTNVHLGWYEHVSGL